MDQCASVVPGGFRLRAGCDCALRYVRQRASYTEFARVDASVLAGAEAPHLWRTARGSCESDFPCLLAPTLDHFRTAMYADLRQATARATAARRVLTVGPYRAAYPRAAAQFTTLRAALNAVPVPEGTTLQQVQAILAQSLTRSVSSAERLSAVQPGESVAAEVTAYSEARALADHAHRTLGQLNCGA